MTADDDAPGGFSLRRWSRRKLAAARAAPASPRPPAAAEPASPPSVPPPAVGTAPVPPFAGKDAGPDPAQAPLPPVDSLHFDSDFTAFMQPKVDATLKREALKKLFRDPRFNVMDGLDIYIGDYSQPDPISPEMVRELHHVRSFFAPPKTRVNAQGFVEDVPPDEPAAAPAAGLPQPNAAATVPPATVPEPVAGAGAAPSTVAPAAPSAVSSAAPSATPSATPATAPSAAPSTAPSAPRHDGDPDQRDRGDPDQRDNGDADQRDHGPSQR